MNIPIEGLVSREPIQEKNSPPSEKNRLNNGIIPDNSSQEGRLSKKGRRGTRFQNYLLAGLTLSSPLLAACGTAVRAGDSPASAEATTAASAEQNPDTSQVNIPLVGKAEPATAEAQKPTTPEKKPLFSKLFPGVDISNAEIIPYKEGTNEFELVGIIVDAGVDLTAYTDLEVSKNAARTPFSGSDAFLDIPENSGSGSISLIGNFEFTKEIPATEKIKTGNKYATTTETDGKNLNGKTIIVWISKLDRSTKKFFTPRELVEKYFPGIYSKPMTQQADYQGQVEGKTIYKYFGGPND